MKRNIWVIPALLLLALAATPIDPSAKVQQRPIHRLYPGPELPASQIAVLKATALIKNGGLVPLLMDWEGGAASAIDLVNGGSTKYSEIHLLAGPHIIRARYGLGHWSDMHFVAELGHRTWCRSHSWMGLRFVSG
jgi:hypothetical protein